MPDQKRNIELLEQVMQHIKDHPEQHRQSCWASTYECGTAACFCGWAALLSGYTVDEIKIKSEENQMTGLGANLLGLNNDEAANMFDILNSSFMLELMVKDLVNGDELRDWNFYYEQTRPWIAKRQR